MAVSSYATPSDLATYLPDMDATANSAIWTTLLAAASREIDAFCGRYFYSDGSSTKYFDGDGTNYLQVSQDFYGSVTLKQAYYENQALASWLTATGDGITPPTNFTLLSDGESSPIPYIAVGGVTTFRPYNEIELSSVPSSGTYLPTFIYGRRTIAVTPSNWGWPAVPDVIKNLTLKLAARAWHSRQGGWATVAGQDGAGVIPVGEHFDSEDRLILQNGNFVRKAP